MKQAYLENFALGFTLSLLAAALGCSTPAPTVSGGTSTTSGSGGPDGGFYGPGYCEPPVPLDGGEEPPKCMPDDAIVEGTLDGKPISYMWTGASVGYSDDPDLIPPFSASMTLAPFNTIELSSTAVVPQSQYTPITSGKVYLLEDTKAPRQILPGSMCRLDCKNWLVECVLNVEGGHIRACAWELMNK